MQSAGQNRSIILAETTVEYSLRRSRRAKGISVAVYPGGEVAVTAPLWLAHEDIEKFFYSRSNSLLRVLFRERQRPRRIRLANGAGEFEKNKAFVTALVHERLNFWNKNYGYSIGKITVRNQKSRWGSCSKKGNLNFNWKIALLPGEMADYIIVHELCHIGEFSHSRKFWELVARTIPNYRALRQRLKNYR